MLIVIPVLALHDNYIWIITDGTYACIIDPGESSPILSALSSSSLIPCCILLTHHHHDHTGGVSDILQRYDIPVYGSKRDNIRTVSHQADDGDVISIPELHCNVDVMAVPGHTRGHVAYYIPAGPWVFTGDALFSAGCGRVFEGTMQEMYESLNRLSSLPNDTMVYCGHEYTVNNLRFAMTVEPDNDDIRRRYDEAVINDRQHKPNVPASMKVERDTNVFLRVNTSDDPVTAFTRLRMLKDEFH